MASGDILSTTILATGWEAEINIDLFSTGGTYNYGDTDTNVANAQCVFTVVSEGYTNGVLGTRTRTVFARPAENKAYPNQAVHNERSNGAGGVIITVVLSEFVYTDDKAGGAGTSGTNPTVTIASGFYKN